MKHIIHRAQERGYASHGWLDSYHSFSFAQYFDPQKVGFGLLRVLNDDRVAPSRGFGTHGHDNMEIISIPLAGTLEHKDDMGNTTLIKTNEVQLMSAGTGVSHSEYNHSPNEWVNFLQLWIFPEERNTKPNYYQKFFDPLLRQDSWQVLVAPDQEEAVYINQKAYLQRISLNSGQEIDYALRFPGNGVYLMVLEGSLEAASISLATRDAIGIWESDSLKLKATADSDVLAIEVPMA